MEKREFKVGDKVKIPKTKSAYLNTPLHKSSAILNAKEINQDFLYVVENIHPEYVLGVCLHSKNSTFHFQDLEHYEEFPEKWAIKLCPEVKKWIEEKYRTNYYSKDSKNHIFHFPNWENGNGFSIGAHTGNEVREGYTPITLEQFQKYVLKEKTMKKEIIGYKLIKPEYEGALKNIEPYWNKELFEKHGYNLAIGSGIYYKFKKAGVLDLWFEPVYEEEKQIIKMYSSNKGEFEIEIVDGKAYYRPENKELPKEWIKDIIDIFGEQGGINYPYKLEVKSVKVGCMEGTRREDWLKVYKLLK